MGDGGRISEISGHTRLLGVMGYPVRHSLSPAIHNASFASLGLDFVYGAMEVAPEKLPEAVRGAVALGYRGFNLTMPHKEAVIPLIDGVDDIARISGSVNTVVIDDSGLTRGYNTDGYGMVEACREAGAKVGGGTVFLLGAGGAASPVALAMMDAGASNLHLFNRSTGRAEELARKLENAPDAGTKIRVYALGDLESSDVLPDILINLTALGMKDEDPLPVPESYLGTLPEDTVVADAVYRPGSRTRLIGAAGALGLGTVAGQRMLLHQGVAAQRLWTGVEPDVRAMDAALS